MYSWSHQLICHSWDESSSALFSVFTVDQSRHGGLHDMHLYREETNFTGDFMRCTIAAQIHTFHSHRCWDNPLTPPHPHTHHTTVSLCQEGCCQGSEWASWLVVSAHHCRNSPVGLAGLIKEAFQDVLLSAPSPAIGSLITLIIDTHFSSSLICSASEFLLLIPALSPFFLFLNQADLSTSL